MLRLSFAKRHCFTLAGAFVATSTFLLVLVSHGQQEPTHLGLPQRSQLDTTTQAQRRSLLESKCAHYMHDPGSPRSLRGEGDSSRRLGTEVVYLLSGGPGPNASVCVPHKVGSHAWGRFAQSFNGPDGAERREDFLRLDFKTRVANTLRAVVLRHPMERLVSVYRMIFQNWCDQDRWLAKQWSNRVCQDKELFDTDWSSAADFQGFIQNGDKHKKQHDIANLVTGMFNEYKYGNDRYMVKIWRKFHPEATSVSRDQLRFTFPEFVRFIVNGSAEFANDEYVRGHQGLSYHWAPYHQECSLCHPHTAPHLILHLDTLVSDVRDLMEAMGRLKMADTFPHTHSSSGEAASSNQELLKRYYSSLTKDQVVQLYLQYKEDHELFGFSPQQFIDYAKK